MGKYYEPHSWKAQELISSSLLNHMENGLATLDDAIVNTNIRNGFITPNEYKNDEETSWSNAFNAAFNAAKSYKKNVLIPAGVYELDNTVEISGLSNFLLIAQGTTINYTGTGYAFELNQLQHVELNFGKITSNGGCLNCTSKAGDDSGSQYVTIKFESFKAAKNYACIHGDIEFSTDQKWFNEVRILDGRMRGNGYGVHIENNKKDAPVSHWNFYNVGFEGGGTEILDACLKLENKDYNKNTKPKMMFSGWSFFGLRLSEPETYTSVFDIDGPAKQFLIIMSNIEIAANSEIPANQRWEKQFFNNTDYHEDLDNWTIILSNDIKYIKSGFFFGASGSCRLDDYIYDDTTTLTDLDEYKIPGRYIVSRGPKGAYFADKPDGGIATPFRLDVEFYSGLGTPTQKFTNLSGSTYYRYFQTSWSEWKQLYSPLNT